MQWMRNLSRRAQLVVVAVAGVTLAIVAIYVAGRSGQPTHDRAVNRAVLGIGVALLCLALLAVDTVKRRRGNSR